MDVTQILTFLLLLLLLAPAWTSRLPCYPEHELREKAERKLRSHYPQPLEPAHVSRAESPASCPVERYQHLVHISERSLSPWRYVYETNQERFPSTLAVAQCLCTGCIVTSRDRAVQEESMDYNSVLIKQSRVLLKKEQCEDGQTYRLVPVSEDVAVGCTCVKPKTRFS